MSLDLFTVQYGRYSRDNDYFITNIYSVLHYNILSRQLTPCLIKISISINSLTFCRDNISLTMYACTKIDLYLNLQVPQNISLQRNPRLKQIKILDAICKISKNKRYHKKK